MNTYLIEPLAPLVFRSGKPFGSQAGADGANFPLPSSMAGMLRTVTADQQNMSFSEDLKQQVVRGPFLARYENSNSFDILVPKPADALYLKDSTDKTILIRLSPKPFKSGCYSDLPTGLLPVQMEQDLKGVSTTGPQYWTLKDLIAWQEKTIKFEDVQANGLNNLPCEQRTHVALNDVTLASESGQLFQTAGLDFQPNITTEGWSHKRLGFIAQTNSTLETDLVTFGGERRLSRLSKVDNNQWMQVNCQLAKQVSKKRGLKLTLVTPATFKQGYLPDWVNAQTLTGYLPKYPSLKLKLCAVIIERWLPVSGWDLAQRKPKAMRKAVAAGAVYWFKVLEGETPDNLHEILWLSSISDDAQDQRDGFGLVLPAAWQPI
jgi:CRISPR-associated protein Cmr3